MVVSAICVVCCHCVGDVLLVLVRCWLLVVVWCVLVVWCLVCWLVVVVGGVGVGGYWVPCVVLLWVAYRVLVVDC